MQFIKRLVPKKLLALLRPVYHGALALMACVYYGRPADKLKVIGVTGTVGKSTTAAILAQILNASGHKCGLITTINFFNGQTDYINKHGLSMPSGPTLQKQLRDIFLHGCRYAVVECTSEGLAQNRHLGINFFMGVITNLSPAHLEAHGGFENYKAAKGRLFKNVKVIGVNLDNAYADYFLNFSAERKFGITFSQNTSGLVGTIYAAEKNSHGFVLYGQDFVVNMPGEFNKDNALMAAAVFNMLGVSLKSAASQIRTIAFIRGRMEPVENSLGIKILVDYGCEPVSFEAALKAALKMEPKKIIHVFGSTGGHRDVAKRFLFGKISAQYADEIIITNDDVYDSDEHEIAQNILTGMKQAEGQAKNYQIILDRQKAIAAAIKKAESGDLVLITGKGSEQFLVLPKNKRIEWDDVGAVKRALQNN